MVADADAEDPSLFGFVNKWRQVDSGPRLLGNSGGAVNDALFIGTQPFGADDRLGLVFVEHLFGPPLDGGQVGGCGLENPA